MLQANNISKTVGETMLFKDICIDIQPGQICSIIGPSGSGKSSVLRSIVTIDQVDTGSISLDNVIYTKIPHPHVYLVSQAYSLRPHLSICENICLPLKHLGIYHEGAYIQLLEKLHISHLVDKYPHQCSGGEQQRIALARAILLQPKYLLLDEPTSALDLEHIQIVSKILQELKATTGILLVTHMIHFAKNISDHIYFMDQGTIIESGKSSILEHPVTQRLQRFLSTY